MEYYSAVKNNDVMKFVGKSLELAKKVILPKVIQKDKPWFVLTYKLTLAVK